MIQTVLHELADNLSERRRLRRTVRNLVAVHPPLYLAVTRLANRFGIVCRETDVVIEGYPRCANSFAEAAFRVAQEKRLRIGHHSHAPAQVLAAVRWRIPTVIVFRNPDDAVVSRMMRSDWVRPMEAFEEYIWFYENIREVLDACVLSSFDLTTRQFGFVMRLVNAKYGTGFVEFDHDDPRQVQQAFRLVDDLARRRVGRGTPYSPAHDDAHHCARERRKAELRESLAARSLRPLRNRARDVYRALLARTVQPAETTGKTTCSEIDSQR